MNLPALQIAIKAQIALAIDRGFRRFNRYDLENQEFSAQVNGNHVNILLVEKHGGHETNVCPLSDLYFSERCNFLRLLLGKGRYLAIAREILPLSDVERVASVEQQLMVKVRGNSPIPYVILGTDRDQNLRFYEGYDEHFLFNKVATFLYILDAEEPVIKQMEEYIIARGGASLSERYLESIRAEIFFTALHQCETFFALLIAPFQPLPHWLYLTIYETKEIKQAVELIVAGKIGDLTDGKITNIQDFIKVAVYLEVLAADLELASRWDENIDNAAWLVERIGKFFLKYDRAYNSYKHGLRVMTGPHQLSIGLQKPDGSIRGPMYVIQASEDSVTYLQKEPIREVDGEQERPISEVTRTFNPFEASFYLMKMSQMLETIKATRLTSLRGGGPVESINTFFGLDRDEVLQLVKHDEWKQEPARADEARVYNQWIAHMRANAEQQTDNTDSATEDHQNEKQE